MDIYNLALSIAYTNKAISQAELEGFKIQVETTRDILETVGKEKTFYFLPKVVSKPQNGYDEYIYVNNNWELMGGTDIDLSGKEDTANKVTAITSENKESTTLYPNIKAACDYVDALATTKQSSIISNHNGSHGMPVPAYCSVNDLYHIGDMVQTSAGAISYLDQIIQQGAGTTPYFYDWQRNKSVFFQYSNPPSSQTENNLNWTVGGRSAIVRLGATYVSGDVWVVLMPSSSIISKAYICSQTVISSGSTQTTYHYTWDEIALAKNYYTQAEIDSKGYLTLENLPIYDGGVE